MEIELLTMTENDWVSVVEIYKEGIATGNATFQLEAPTYTEWDNDHLKNCRIVALLKNKMVGWAALSPVSGRCIYVGVAEVSVYVSVKFRGHKIGKQLLNKLIVKSEKEKLWTLQAGVSQKTSRVLKFMNNSDLEKLDIEKGLER